MFCFTDLTQKIRNNVEASNKVAPVTMYDLERMEEYVSALFTFAKFKIGDKVKMAETYPVNVKDSWGWMSCRHLLEKGSKATVKEVDYHKGRFVYLVEFKDRTYTNDKNEILPSNDRTRLSLGEKWLSKG